MQWLTNRHRIELLAVGAAGILMVAGCSSNEGSKVASTPPQAGSGAPEGQQPAGTPDAPESPNASATPETPAATPSEAPGASSPTAPSSGSAAKTVTGPSASKAAAAARSNPAGGGSQAASESPKVGGKPTPRDPGLPAPTPTPSGDNGGATDRGVTAEEVKFGGIFMYQFGGLDAQLFRPMSTETRALINAVNDSGGIYGRKLTYIDCDDGHPDPARTRACYKKLVEQDKIFAMLSGCSLNEDQYQADLKRDQIPAFSPCSLYQVEWQNPFSFPVHMDMRQEATASATWALNVKKPKTYGVLCLNIPDSQAACGRVKKRMNEAGAKLVFERTFRSGTPDMSGDVIAARAASPDFIFDYSIDPFVGARFYVDAAQQDYWPPMGIVSNHKTAEAFGPLIGSYPAKKGYWNNTTFKLWGADYKAWQKKFAPQNKGVAHHLTQGPWFGSNAMLECMRRVGPNLTRPAMMECMNSQRWETGPGLDQSVMWSPAQRYADGTLNTKEYMYKYESANTVGNDDGSPNGWVPDKDQFVITAPTPTD